MYVIHDALVGEETITFAYIRATVVIRMCFPTHSLNMYGSLSHFPFCYICLFLDLVSCSILFRLGKDARLQDVPVSLQRPSNQLPFRPLPEPHPYLSLMKRQMEAESSSAPLLWAHTHIRAPVSSWWHQGHLQVNKGILRLAMPCSLSR